MRAAGAGTATARLDAPAGAAVRVVVAGGERIAVTADVTPRRVAVGEDVRLVARADAAPPGARFRWHLGDGVHRDGRELTHRFRRAGRHEVFVTVTAGALSGASAARTVTVGAVPATPAPRDERPASAGSAGPGGGPAGARRRGRGGARARAGDGSSTGGSGRDGSAAPNGRAPAASARPSAGWRRGGGPTPAPDHRPGQRGGGPRAASRGDGAARSGPGTVSGTVLAGPDAAGASAGAAAPPDASVARPASEDAVTGADATAVPTWRRPVVALGAALGLAALAGVVAEARAGRGPDRRRRRWSSSRQAPTTAGPR
nr:PKD domain-containing protein [Patulibacter sp. SYSU D01012]